MTRKIMNIDNIINKLLPKGRLLSSILLGAILIPFISSCSDELPYPYYGEDEMATVPISISVQPIQSENPRSRAITYLEPTDDETKIHDFWIIEYHENGTRIGLPRYYRANGDNYPEIRIIVPRRDTDTYTCVMIANTNDPELFNANNTARYSTLDDLRRFELGTHNHEHVFNPSGEKYLLMSGWTTITTDPKTHKLSFDLIRNVSKVKVTMTNFDDTGLVYKYFQWRDVPLGKAFPHGNIDYTQHVSRDWKQHLDDDPDESQKRKDLEEGLIFYMPCNVWLPEGPEIPGVRHDKTTREEDPTHFVVVAREKLGEDYDGCAIESGEQYEFCLYPSLDVDTQFDFKPNHYYEMEMDISCLPAEKEENPFINLIDYKYLPESNCYMMKRDSKEFYAVPITRINRYWSKFGEKNEKGDIPELIDDDTEWVAEVIWQDTPESILEFTSFRRFQVSSDKSRLEAKGNTYYTLEGETIKNKVPYLWDKEGNELEYLPMCFAFRTTGSGEGNVVVGVRKKVPGWENIPVDQREYLWSWHIWITDYDPYAYTPGVKWIHQDVPGGQVQRYPDAGMVGSDENDDDWPCIMDRNLGATKTIRYRQEAEDFNNDVANGNWASRIADAIKMFGLYYQYGRKDPFPYPDQTIYDIKGHPISEFNGSPNMIISTPHEAVRKSQAVRKRSARKIATRSDDDDDDNDKNHFAGYDPHPVRLSIKYPYKFYACASDVKMGDLEALKPEDGTDKIDRIRLNTSWTGDTIGMRNWMSPGIETYSGKNLLDPCPVGWIMPDVNSLYGEVSTDSEVDYLEAIYSSIGGVAYYTGTLLLYDLTNKYEFAYFPATGSRDGTNGKGPEGNIWAVGTTVGLTNYLWTIGRKSVSMCASANPFCVTKEPSLGVPIRCMREFPLDF